MSKYKTTLSEIRKHSPCGDGWTKLLNCLDKTEPDDEPLDIETILTSNGLDDTLWSLRALGEEHNAAVRLLVCDLVEPAMAFVTDGEERPQKALKAARDFAKGLISKDELEVAWDAARAAAWDAARAAELAADLAAARADVWAAAWAAARAASDAALDASDAALDASDAALDAKLAARAQQEVVLKKWIEEDKD